MRFPAFVAFFLSGASSLIFQNIWGRMLHHVFGSTSVAVSTVVTVFMGGLGLGAWLAGRWADRVRHPIITYAFFELGVGLWAMLVPLLVDPQGWLADMNEWLRVEMGTGSLGFMLGRFLFVLPVLLLPTTLMGASLPLLARHFVQAEQRAGVVGSRVGVLYAVNTFGAVAGVLMSGFVLMPAFGVNVTNGVAIAFNLVLALGVYLLRGPLLGDTWAPGQKLEFLPRKDTAPAARASEATSETDAERKGDEPAPDEDESPATPDAAGDGAAPVQIPPIGRKIALFAFGASGAAALCYEVAWTRALAMTIGASIYSFTIILSTFLIGIASGSSIGSAALGSRKHMLNVIAAASVVLTLLANALWGVENGWSIWLLVSAVLSLPVAVVWGAVVARSRSAEAATQAQPKSGGDEIDRAWRAKLAPNVTAPALVMLAVPVSASLLNWVLFDGRLPPIIAGVTCAVCVFLALMLTLRGSPLLQLATIQLFIAGATFINYAFQDELPCGFARMVGTIEDLPQHVGTVQFFMFLSAALCTLPATLGMGAMFPLTLRTWTGGGRGAARDTSVVYTSNTMGSIVGSWLPGFVLMPLFGLERTLHSGMVLNLALALLMLIASTTEPGRAVAKVAAAREERKKRRRQRAQAEGSRIPVWHAVTVYVLAPLIPAVVALLYLGTANPGSKLRWDLSQMTLGVFRVSLAQDACSESWGQPDLVYYNDGMTTTVSVEKWGRHLALKNNGKVDASNGDDMPTQIMVAAFPILMHPEGAKDKDVAIVGFGSGVTVGSALQFPVDHVDVIELEKSTVEASWWFRDVNHLEYASEPGEPGWEFPYVDMERLHVINDDGRNYLSSTNKKYDVIISEPSNPWITGVSDLFTTDHFKVTKDRLKPGGVYCQWVQLYEMSPKNIKTIYRTFASQFDHVVVFAAEDLSSDTILLGSNDPLPLDLRRIEQDFQYSKVTKELDQAYVSSPFDVLSRTLLANRKEVMQYTRVEYHKEGGEWVPSYGSSNDPDEACEEDKGCRREPVPVNTDDMPRIEFSAPKDLIGYEAYEGYLTNIYSPEWPYGRLPGKVKGFGEGDEAARNYAELAMSLIAHGRKSEATKIVERSQQAGESRKTVVALEVLSLLLGREHEPKVPIEPPVPGPQLARQQAEKLAEGFEKVRKKVDQGAYGQALTAMEEIPSPLRRHSGPGLRLLHAYLLYKTADMFPGHHQKMIDILEDLVANEQEYVLKHPEIYYFLARAHDEELHFDRALRNMRAYVEMRLTEQQDGGSGEQAPTTDAPGETDKSDKEGKPEEASDPSGA